MSKHRIMLAGEWFIKDKISNAKFRKSFLGIWNPYILEIDYKEPWTQWLPMYNISTKSYSYIPIYHKTTDYKFKYPSLCTVKNEISSFKKVGILYSLDIPELKDENDNEDKIT